MRSITLGLHLHRGYPQSIGGRVERPADGSWCGIISMRWISLRLGVKP